MKRRLKAALNNYAMLNNLWLFKMMITAFIGNAWINVMDNELEDGAVVATVKLVRDIECQS